MTQQPQTLWTSKLNQPASISPIIVGNHLLFATKPSSPMDPNSDLIGVNLEDGQVVWQHHFDYIGISQGTGNQEEQQQEKHDIVQ